MMHVWTCDTAVAWEPQCWQRLLSLSLRCLHARAGLLPVGVYSCKGGDCSCCLNQSSVASHVASLLLVCTSHTTGPAQWLGMARLPYIPCYVLRS